MVNVNVSAHGEIKPYAGIYFQVAGQPAVSKFSDPH